MHLTHAPASLVVRGVGADSPDVAVPSQPFVMLVFGASGDLTKRLLVPALYNLACDGLLSDNFALIGTAMDPLTTESFRARMTEDIKKVHTRRDFDPEVWDHLVARFHYHPGTFSDAAVFQKLKGEVQNLSLLHGTGGNVLFYFATAPKFFGTLCENLHKHDFKSGPGWKRIIGE